jgi:hypothetical protein
MGPGTPADRCTACRGGWPQCQARHPRTSIRLAAGIGRTIPCAVAALPTVLTAVPCRTQGRHTKRCRVGAERGWADGIDAVRRGLGLAGRPVTVMAGNGLIRSAKAATVTNDDAKARAGRPARADPAICRRPAASQGSGPGARLPPVAQQKAPEPPFAAPCRRRHPAGFPSCWQGNGTGRTPVRFRNSDPRAGAAWQGGSPVPKTGTRTGVAR